MSDSLIDRLHGRYAMGPHLPNGRPEFGIRQFETAPICKEAAKRIAELEAENERLREMLTELANLGVPQNGRGCLYCGAMTTHKPVCEVPHILAALAAETPSEETTNP